MSLKARNSFDRTKMIAENTPLDPDNPIQAGTIGAVLRVLRGVTDMDELASALELAGATTVRSAESKQLHVVGKAEYTTLTNPAGGKITTGDFNKVQQLGREGWSIVDIVMEDIMG